MATSKCKRPFRGWRTLRSHDKKVEPKYGSIHIYGEKRYSHCRPYIKTAVKLDEACKRFRKIDFCR